MMAVAGRALRVATSRGAAGTLPFLFFNGIGANLDLIGDFAAALEAQGVGSVIFDVPGIGDSSAPSAPYRFSWLAKLADDVLGALGIAGQVDVGGVSWGGGLAQEFTHRYPLRVRRLVLAATTAGALALPGRLSALTKMVGARRYADPAYMARVGGELYGGKFRSDPQLLERYGKRLRAPRGGGYFFQLLAGVGWTSAHWLGTLRQPTLVLMGTDDPIVPLANGRLLAKLIRNAHLVTIDDGHLFLLSSSAQCAPLIADFLKHGSWPRT